MKINKGNFRGMKNKKAFYVILVIFGFLLISLVLLNIYIKNQIEKKINSPGENKIEYRELDAGFLGRDLEISGFSYTSSEKEFTAETISIQDFSLWQYIVNNRIAIDEINIIAPQLTWSGTFKNKGKKQGQLFDKEIRVKDVVVLNGIIEKKDVNSEKSKIYLNLLEFHLSGVNLSSSTLKNRIPVEYNSYSIQGDSIQLMFNSQHRLAAGDFSAENGKVDISDFNIIPLYNREEFYKKVPYEKDRISLHVKDVTLDDLSFKFRNDTLHLLNSLTNISGADLFIYRNRSLPDDPNKKSLYSEQLRKLPVKIDFETTKISSGRVEYEEATKREGGPAKISFNEIRGTIENLTNLQKSKDDSSRVRIKANSLFMNEAPVEIDWSFNVFNRNDKFLFSGESRNITGSAVNSYLIPAMGIEAKGTFNSVYFTITGDEEKAVGDVRVNYGKFKIHLLEDSSREENEIISAIANLFLDNDGHTGESVQRNIEVERDKTKTFWFYTWTAIRKGLIESVEQL